MARMDLRVPGENLSRVETALVKLFSDAAKKEMRRVSPLFECPMKEIQKNLTLTRIDANQ